MRSVRPPLVSEAEFLSLPESMNKMELLDGEVVIAPVPSAWHQEVLLRIVVALKAWQQITDTTVTVGLSPIDVRFGPDRILQPDAFVLLDVIARDHKGPVERIPEICVEILSTNRVHDRVTKRLIYAEAGVKEYWIVEPEGPIERRTGPGLATVEIVDDRLTSALLPEFELVLADVFA